MVLKPWTPDSCSQSLPTEFYSAIIFQLLTELCPILLCLSLRDCFYKIVSLYSSLGLLICLIFLFGENTTFPFKMGVLSKQKSFVFPLYYNAIESKQVNSNLQFDRL